MVGATSAAAVWYLSEVGEQRWLWLAGGLTFISVWPWTLLAMMPDISKLHEEDVLKKEGMCNYMYIGRNLTGVPRYTLLND